MEPSLIECGIQDIRAVLGTGVFGWLGPRPFAGIERGDDPGAAVDRCLADVPVDQPSALVGRWQAGLQNITIANSDAIVTVCQRRMAQRVEIVVTTGIVPEAGVEKTKFLLFVRVI